MADVKYEIVKKLKVLSEGRNGWTKEVNIAKWGNGKPKLDIRLWNHDEGKVGKGVSLDYEEKEFLLDVIDGLDF